MLFNERNRKAKKPYWYKKLIDKSQVVVCTICGEDIPPLLYKPPQVGAKKCAIYYKGHSAYLHTKKHGDRCCSHCYFQYIEMPYVRNKVKRHEECHCKDKDLRNAEQEFLEHALIYEHMEWIMKELNKLRFDSIEDVLDFSIANARAYNEYERTLTLVGNSLEEIVIREGFEKDKDGNLI